MIGRGVGQVLITSCTVLFSAQCTCTSVINPTLPLLCDMGAGGCSLIRQGGNLSTEKEK